MNRSKKEDNTYQTMSTASDQRKKNRFEMVPDNASCEGNTTIVLLFDEVVPTGDGIQVLIRTKEKNESVSTKRINSRSFSFIAPEHREGTVLVIVCQNTIEVGSASLQYKSDTINIVTGLSQLYMHFMSQICHFMYSVQDRSAVPNSLSQLDDLLAGSFNENKGVGHVPAVAFEEIFDINRHLPLSAGTRSQYEIPTLLHLAAQFGLQNLTVALMDFPGAVQASSMVNARGKTPCQIARESGHNGLAQVLTKLNPASDYDHPTTVLRRESVENIRLSRSQNKVETQYPIEKPDSDIYMRADPEVQDDTYSILTSEEAIRTSRRSIDRNSTFNSRSKPAPTPCAKFIQRSSSFLDSKPSTSDRSGSGYDVPPPPVPVRISRDSGAYTDSPNTSRAPSIAFIRNQTDRNSETQVLPSREPRRQSHDTAAPTPHGRPPSGRISESAIIKAQLSQLVPTGSGRPGPSVTK